jgi:hypothetical protein
MKLALSVLSGIETSELVAAIRQGDVARLTGIPGIGKKTAERIGLELKDKMAAFLPAEDAASPAASTSDSLRGDILSALINLGYNRPLAERAVEGAMKSGANRGFETLLKYALRARKIACGEVLHRCAARAPISRAAPGHVRSVRFDCMGMARKQGVAAQDGRAWEMPRICAQPVPRSGGERTPHRLIHLSRGCRPTQQDTVDSKCGPD